MTYAAMYLDRLIGVFNRQLPISMVHINQIAVVSDKGRIVNLMRGQGSVYHRLVPSSVSTEKDVTRQFQHPVFSTNGKYVAFSEMYFKDKAISRADALVFEVPTEASTYGIYNISISLLTIFYTSLYDLYSKHIFSLVCYFWITYVHIIYSIHFYI
jgi:hypothetical protein